MNKNIKRILISIAAAMALAGCYEDQGNYDYISDSEAMPVTIGALDSISVTANSELSITPQLTGTDNGDYSYLWYVITDGSSYYTSECDTLSDERNLNVNINLKVGKYTLYYRVTDLSTGVYRSVTTPLTVTGTDITSGWYVMKTADGGVDFDYYSLSGESDRNNFLTSVVETGPMSGTPCNMIFQTTGYGHETENEDGTVTTDYNLSALHILTSSDYLVLSGSDMSTLSTLETMFYEEPDEIDFKLVAKDDYDDYGSQILINGSSVHTLGEIGRWGYKKAGNYNLLPVVINADWYLLVFDTISNKFYDCGMFSQTGMDDIYSFTDFDVFHELADSAFTVSRCVIHQDHTDSPDVILMAYSPNSGKHYAAQIEITWGTYVSNVTYHEIPEDSPLLTSTVMAMPTSATVIYYAVENKLYM